MIATEEQTSQHATNSQTPDKLDMNSRKNIMKNMYSQSKRNQGTDSAYTGIPGMKSQIQKTRSRIDFTEILTLSVATIAIVGNIYFFVTIYSFSFPVICWSVFGIIIGMTLADFFGGFVHWAADTWFTIEMPILGPK